MAAVARMARAPVAASGPCATPSRDAVVPSLSAGTCCCGKLVNDTPVSKPRLLKAERQQRFMRSAFLSGAAQFSGPDAPRGRALHRTRISPRNSGAATALFTGIVEEMGKVRSLEEVDGGWELVVEASVVLEDAKLGDSIAVNGTCLTVTRFDTTQFAVGLSPETLRRTSLGEVGPGSPVNLERSLQPISRMGGHFVQGHVDGTGTILSFRPDADSLWVTIKTTPDLIRYIVPKGYIAVDGTSLTVVDVFESEDTFTFMLVAYTQSKIVIPSKKVGDKVNLEVDIVGKYVERFLGGYRAEMEVPQEAVTAKLGEWGSLGA